jgi:hypothetical protein
MTNGRQSKRAWSSEQKTESRSSKQPNRNYSLLRILGAGAAAAVSNHRHDRPGWKGDTCLEAPQKTDHERKGQVIFIPKPLIKGDERAAHAADLVKGHPGAQYRDNAISKARPSVLAF